ncbi:hypothetical protein DICPUDRAFT_94025 [Dictyostelium purpureum]|uniref:Glucosamine/galactosamine-6-phosphate isomerase domain-containing protein n=1 Tax=Dictyostelium purpureum TaxID=5786 RepID=F0ZEE8_DICPU|nr:uncharacterized protein DICPUDRAFT_94025 [Dictyostelium purpureum]EGC37679.1 hypothetical protein DICPUDRAFT_94025 [Dictyostelium purpureum]|eukprot:XP_003285783.1 hypothetical protein DICPUDRAFT_94025 [Dictyostelium purpureum]
MNNKISGINSICSETGYFECVQEFKSKEKLPTLVYHYPDQASKFIALEIVKAIEKSNSEGKSFVLGLAAGSTPSSVYDHLVKLYQEKKVSFKNVITFNIDEYYPIKRSKIQSYYRFMQENFFELIDINKENINFLNGEIKEEEIDEHLKEYEKKIEKVGGLDLILVPLGKRIGFNEAGSPFNTKTRLVDLEQNTRIDSASDFFGTEHVPHHALTMGLSTIFSSKRVILMAFSEGKASIVQKTTEGDITISVPSSIFQNHKNCQLVIDESAAVEITRCKQPWTIQSTSSTLTIKWTPLLARKAVIWLSLKLGKPILKLEEEEYHDNNLSSLLKAYGPCHNLNLKVFRNLQATINVIVFSPHPDDDVISMGGTFIRLCDQGHQVHVAYQTSGNIAVWDDDAVRFANFGSEFARIFKLGGDSENKSKQIEQGVEDFIKTKEPGQPDSKEIQLIKGLIRQTEARAGARYAGVRSDRIHFLDLPFYETGAVKKKPLGEEDIQIMVKFLESVKPEIIFAAGDLSDPHGTHRVCLKAILAAIERLKNNDWMKECQVWLYRGAWQEWEPERIEMAVPMSPFELQRKRMSIFKHQSQKDVPAFPGTDKREFWMRAEDRNRATAKIYDKLGLTEFEGMEAFVSWSLNDGTNY